MTAPLPWPARLVNGAVVSPRAAVLLDRLLDAHRRQRPGALDPEEFEVAMAIKAAARTARDSSRAAPEDCTRTDMASVSVLLSTAEVAAALGIQERAVRRAAQERRLHGFQTGSGWQFPPEALADYRPRTRRSA